MDQIIGHSQVLQTLEKLFETERIPHALMLIGPKGIGKRKIAERFGKRLILGASSSMSLMGENEPLAYDEGHPYFPQIEAGSCPDYLAIEPEDGKKSIGVEGIRKTLSKLALSSEGKRVVIVDAADDMNNNAANALLKTLEEPGEGIHLILLVHSQSKILPTIISRCRQFRVSPLGDVDVLDVLKKEAPDTDASELKKFATLSGGCPGEALKQLNEGAEILPLIQEFLDNRSSQTVLSASQLSEKIAVKKAVPLALDMLLSVLSASAKANLQPHDAEIYQKVQKRLDEMTVFNVNPQLTLEAALNDVLK